MKKYTFLVYHKEYRKFLTQLGNLGVLHVIERDELKEDELLTEQNNQIELYQNALKSINTAREKYPSSKQNTRQIPETPEQVLAVVENLNQKKTDAEEKIDRLNSRIERLIPWGEYDSEHFTRLSNAGYKMYFYLCPVNQFKEEWEKDDFTFRVNEQNGNIYFVIVSMTGIEPEIGLDHIILPSKPMSIYQKELDEKMQELLAINDELSWLSQHSSATLKSRIQSLETESSMISVMLDSVKTSEDKLMALEGWVPKELEEKLLTFLDKQDILFYSSKREENEFPPVLLKNSKFSKLFEPISKLFDLPGYSEMDLTPYFAPFFMIFFGFCLGDAGYGVFFIIIAAILKLKVKKDFKPVLTLLQYFGIATIIFGMVSGTFFGMNLIDSGYTITAATIKELKAQDVPESVVISIGDIEGEYFQSRSAFLKAISMEMDESSFQTYKQEIVKHSEPGIPLFSKFRHLMRDSLFMFYFALFLGGLQILFGIFIRIFNITKREGFKYAFPTLGWFILVLTLVVFNVADKFGWFSKEEMKIPYYILLGISAVMILFLNTPGASIFTRLGSGIWDSYSTVTGLFGDILSYIRLFALGLSSGILGFVFNDIALQFLDIPYIGWLFFLIMLIFGHTLNIFLATLGGFVHPMRLTFVEFYKNAGFKGGGKEYKPFKINT